MQRLIIRDVATGHIVDTLVIGDADHRLAASQTVAFYATFWDRGVIVEFTQA